jgi:hypothetical protein
MEMLLLWLGPTIDIVACRRCKNYVGAKTKLENKLLVAYLCGEGNEGTEQF